MLFFDKGLGEDVLDMAEQHLNEMSINGIIQKPKPHVGYMVILDATREFGPDDADFESAILCEGAFNKDEWPDNAPYKEYARAKARLAWREKMNTFDIVKDEPWRLRNGDIRYGGAIYRKGIVTSFSGVEEYNDELIAKRADAGFTLLLRNRAGVVIAKQSAYIDSSTFPDLTEL